MRVCGRESERGGRGAERRGGKRVDVSAGIPVPLATYGNVIRGAFRRMLSCVFALLRNHVVLSRPLRPLHPPFSPRVSFSCLPSALPLPDNGNRCQWRGFVPVSLASGASRETSEIRVCDDAGNGAPFLRRECAGFGRFGIVRVVLDALINSRLTSVGVITFHPG